MSCNLLRPGTGIGYTYYDILQLAHKGGHAGPSKDEIKVAYRRALLIHHPDKIPDSHVLKSPSNETTIPSKTPRYSIDEIVTAYQVLLDPVTRTVYDQTLERNDNGKELLGHKGTHLGVEVYDLEDLTFDEDKNTWSKGCRCGDEQGYVLTEQDLERESQNAEIYVGCRGCSLFVKVFFAVEEPE